MLYSKVQITQRIDEFKAYCVANGQLYLGVNWDNVFSPLYGAVNDYFSADMSDISKEVNFLIHAMYCDILRRTTKHENDYQFDFNNNENYPLGYSDLRLCFYDFSHITNTSNQTVFNSCVYDQTTMSVKSTLIEGWVEELGIAHNSDIEKVTNLAEWCADCGSNCGLINLLENRGKLLEIQRTREIAKTIYIDRFILDVIRWFNLTSYIPTYYKGE